MISKSRGRVDFLGCSHLCTVVLTDMYYQRSCQTQRLRELKIRRRNATTRHICTRQITQILFKVVQLGFHKEKYTDDP